MSISSEYDLPRRAPIQFWMMSTFALFVGIAVVVVGLYASLVLENRVEAEAGWSVIDQARALAGSIDRFGSEREMEATLRQFSRITGQRITIWKGDSVTSDFRAGFAVSERRASVPDQRLLKETMRGRALISREGLTDRVVYAAVRVEGTDMTVRVGKRNPPIFDISDRMQATLMVGLIFALILAVLGGWIAAQRVADPIKELALSARRINEGQLSEEILVETRASEFQDLTVNLNAMADRFRDDIEKLQRLIRIQNEFLGNISHEVRNPIFAINGYIEALASPRLTEEQRLHYARKGVANLERLSTLFSDLIEIARLEYREDLIHPEPLDLKDLVEEVVETARSKARQKGLHIKLDLKPTMAFADRSRIRQVITNLIENAIAYSDSGSVECTVREEDESALVEIADTGRGIDRQHVERIFDRFYRVDAARSRKYGGSGLGLSIVKQILHAHGVQIHVQSKVGEGSKFWFKLPLVTEDANNGVAAAERSEETSAHG
ncbi:MAG: HAMP domain-containing sensor histidine kinase [Rhodothermales bacterium]